MNERIQELRAKAVLPFQKDRGYTSWVFSEEKFAELIVRECAEIGNKAWSDIGNYSHIGDKIKQHFGVWD